MASNGNGLRFSVANIIVLFVLVASIAATWGSLSSSLANTCEKVKVMDAKIDDLAGTPFRLESLSKDLAHFGQELSDTREEMARLREDMRDRTTARGFEE